MEFIINIFWFLVFLVLIRKLPFFRNIPGASFRWLAFFFGIKVFSGFILIYIYTFYYTDKDLADIYKYFNDAKVIFGAMWEYPADYFRMLTGIGSDAVHLDAYYQQMSFWNRPWELPLYNDNRLVIRFNALVMLFSGGYITVHNLFINFLSFSGLVAMYKLFIRYADPGLKKLLLAGLFLFPGLLFWGSGILKEGLLIFCFGFWILKFDDLFSTSKRAEIIQAGSILIFVTFFLFLLKPYTLFLWIPCMLGFYLARNGSVAKVNLLIAGFILLMGVLGVLSGFLIPDWDLIRMIASKQNNSIDHSLLVEAGSIMHTDYLQPNLFQMVVFFARGLFYTLFRPHLFDSFSLVTLFAAIENLLVLLALIFSIIRFNTKSAIKNNFLWSCFWFTLLLFGFVGMVSVTYGSIVRYKIPALPFLLFFLLHIIRFPKFDKGLLQRLNTLFVSEKMEK